MVRKRKWDGWIVSSLCLNSETLTTALHGATCGVFFILGEFYPDRVLTRMLYYIHGTEIQYRKAAHMFYNVFIFGSTKLNDVPVTRKEAKNIAENYSGAKIVKVGGPYFNGKPVVVEESRQHGWVFVTYLTGERGELAPKHEIVYK